MYFCPCSCSKPDCENEEDVLICLPRNLSYAGESYLDRYSVSSAFVHNGKLEKQLLKSDVEEQYLKAGATACAEVRKIEQELGERGRGRRGEVKGGGSGGAEGGGGCTGGGGGGGGGEEEEEEEEEGEASVSEHLLGARAMSTRPLTYMDENSLFKGGPDQCDFITADTVPVPAPVPAMSLQPQSSSSSSPPRSPDPDDPPASSSSSSSPSSPPLGVLPPPQPPSSSSSSSPPQLTVTIARAGSGGGGSGDKNLSEDAGVGMTTTMTTTATAAQQQAALFDRYVLQQTATESPDSDLVSEEGIFVNLMDDLEGLSVGPMGGKSTLSEASDDTYVSGDSMYYSPQEVDDMAEDHQVRGQDLKVSLEEAVQQAAAFVFQASAPGSMSPPLVPSEDQHHHHHHDAECPAAADSSVVVISLPRPHANDGESEDSATGSSTDGETTKKNESGQEELHPPGYSAGPVLQVAATTTTTNTTESSDLASGDADQSDTPNTGPAADPPQSPKTPSSLGIKLLVPVVATSSTTTMGGSQNTNADGGGDSSKGPQLSSSFHDLLSPNSPLYDDREFNFHRTELRKSTSLKSTKTPPGTPRRKKVVRFADAMGLDLESVRHVLNLESPPKIPPSAMKDLHPGLSEDRKGMGSRFISETFPQPGVDPRFRERVMAERVSLENALIVSGSITGVVRVANIAFHKAVRVRFTTNGWASFHDIAASYMVNSNDGPTDRFSFTIVPPPDFCPGASLEFAISYSVNGVEYWDNNFGKNYVFECYAKTVPTEAENAWMHFL